MNLLNKIEEKLPESLALRIYFLGQSGYVIKTADTILYIDPYLSDYVENPAGLNDRGMKRLYPPLINPGDIQKINGVICTHAHADHMDPWTLEKIRPFFSFFSSQVSYDNSSTTLEGKKITYLLPRQAYVINDIKIEPIPAAHYALDDGHGKPDCLSFIITIGNKRLFFWGDGIIYERLLDELIKYEFDYFFAPINGRDWFRDKAGIIGNMNARELAELCSQIKINVVIPNHFDLFDYNSESVDHFLYYLHKFSPSQKYRILTVGETIDA